MPLQRSKVRMFKTILLKNDRTLQAAYSRAGARCKQWIVYLPESGSSFLEGTQAELQRFLMPSVARQFNYLAINKPGMGRGQTDRKAFESSFRRQRRVEDALTAIRAIVPAHHRIYIIGYSEGAYLAPEVASQLDNVTSIIMIGGGTRGWLKEELNNASAKEKPQVRRKIQQIRRQPESTEKWNGFSFATWHSYKEDTTYKVLQKLDCSVLSILGSRDRIIDLKAALRDMKQLARKKKPVTTELLQHCGHDFKGHWKEVRIRTSEHLRAHFIKD